LLGALTNGLTRLTRLRSFYFWRPYRNPRRQQHHPLTVSTISQRCHHIFQSIPALPFKIREGERGILPRFAQRSTNPFASACHRHGRDLTKNPTHELQIDLFAQKWDPRYHNLSPPKLAIGTLPIQCYPDCDV
jgi:hypothetical protein